MTTLTRAGRDTAPAPTPATAPGRPRVRGLRSRVAVLFLVLTAGIVTVALISAAHGQYGIGLSDVAASIAHKWSGPLHLGHPVHDRFAEATLWQVRMPRVIMSLLVGAVLATAGAVMQGIFGNPLAEPAVVGVSSGAAVGAAIVIVAGIGVLGQFTVPAAAFVGGLVTVLTVYVLSRSNGRSEVVTLVLTGIAVNAVTGAGLAFCLFFGSQTARDQIVFWQLGSLNGSRWSYVAIVAPMAAVGLVGAMVLARRLDLLALGDRAARHLGVHVERLRLVSIVLVTFMVAAAVAFSGIIGFVGLVVPHLIRMAVGPGHRVLVPASLLAGGLLLACADLVARTAIHYADLPIGMLTALVGGPFFFWLLRRTRSRAGGWA
ncbi:iron complex transport system permease protein [Jatrophihabitans endophyticus]|uniref:Iron complex transport system permease protein n=1 Tax=Jatrophihabitans endophyticus TaxID=1206085 RepID=A0A1M5Q4J6_9ACTN|nr:iron ABC transporter permease [Jatrophihabitans endophyticus]SHH08701.1 iron complex transport system permease protein [Jatrophihabitans endophyticus]